MEQRRNPRENPPTSGIVRLDPHVRKSGSHPAGNAVMLGRGKREIPEEARRPATSSGTVIPTCESPGATPLELGLGSPRWDASSLPTTPPPPPPRKRKGGEFPRVSVGVGVWKGRGMAPSLIGSGGGWAHLVEAVIDDRTRTSLSYSLGDGLMRKGDAPSVTLAFIGALFGILVLDY
ncbi:hypothetical protein PR048_028907 [Dryococelus australis]|uniref:Uncharacterized protein n=1 Tax=Dryococelus australis TaxID=614101 RepID=A0ABQ9GCA1_9NEOP|nr:hypothetical protein PR048_028907 [Dryococelus australis]